MTDLGPLRSRANDAISRFSEISQPEPRYRTTATSRDCQDIAPSRDIASATAISRRYCNIVAERAISRQMCDIAVRCAISRSLCDIARTIAISQPGVKKICGTEIVGHASNCTLTVTASGQPWGRLWARRGAGWRSSSTDRRLSSSTRVAACPYCIVKL